MKKYRVKKSKEELRTIRSDAMNKVIAAKNEIKRTHPNWSKEKICLEIISRMAIKKCK